MQENKLPKYANEFWRAVCIERCKHGSEGDCWKSARQGNSPAVYPTWYASEFDGEEIFFGLVIGYEIEFGYFALSELQTTRGPFGLQIERDLHYESKSLRELKAMHEKERRI
ncbi:MAG: hypothetical protein A3K41_10995 [Chloroflexi bacterium RIFOXYD12_FULL_57_15]|nr:MAG: hypothetical protein A3K41_10995 [Chloroflexi bacterium RIFOXYD12_FULL_57_15]